MYFFSHIERYVNDLLRPPPDFHQKVQKSPKDWVFHQRVTELQTNIFKKIALHFAPFMI